jgi:adenosine deaminase
MNLLELQCSCLKDYIKCADRAVEINANQRTDLELVTSDLFKQLKKDNVIYAEIRFAPLLHLKGGLSSTEVVKIVSQITKNESKKTGIEARFDSLYAKTFPLKSVYGNS